MHNSLPQAQHLAAKLPPLLLEAERVAEAVRQGVHGRRRAGPGESFWQFRRYEPGDGAERIDWRQSARGDKVFVREREWEAAQSAYVWADRSGSMRYASDDKLPTKIERAQVLMLALASLLLRGGEKVVWFDGDQTLSVHGTAGIERIASRLNDGGGDVREPPDVKLPRHAHMVLCSDFLMAPEILQQKMHRYAGLHVGGVLLHVLDPAEEAFAFQGRVEMEDGENPSSLLLPNAASLRDAYRARMDDHKARLLQMAENAGWFYVRHVTDTPPHLSLLKLYNYVTAEKSRGAR